MRLTPKTTCTATPDVTVLDNRGLSIGELQYHRHPDTPDKTDERITRHQYDARGALMHSIDPRLSALRQAKNTTRPNFSYLTALSGTVLTTDSVDAGLTLSLSDVAGRPHVTVNASGVTRRWQYEASTLSGRPLSMAEQSKDDTPQVTERFVYAGQTVAEKDLNLAGQCVRHYDTAGLSQVHEVSLTGGPLSVSRQLLPDDIAPHWQGETESAWIALLSETVYTTHSTMDARGQTLTTADAKGNLQRVAYNVAGLLSGSWLTLKKGAEQVIVASLTYSAAGQKLREEHGNGVVTTYTYEPQTLRLIGIKTERPAGHVAGATTLQDLRYDYDPVGNVLKIANDAEETRFWRNQKVVPENTYVYDSLYQLVSATGREMANAGQQGSNLPSAAVPLSTDGSAYTNYTRTYAYDNAGNLTQIRHSAPATKNNYTTDITISDRSNRGVLNTLTETAADVDALFTAGGQQKQLLAGQSLAWTPRNELLRVTPVVRDGAEDDGESYRYDSSSQRMLKVSVQKTNTSTQTQRVVYLPGLELRTSTTGSTETENLQVITVGEAGRAQVRVLHWESGRPEEISNDQIRYSYDNLIGSSGVEVNGDGNVISREEYYPYGATAILTARSAVEADYKTVRYSGKERDATGLYYYGYRYYQPWAGRWLSADPAGTVDGLNLFRMVQNDPISGKDADGLFSLNIITAINDYRAQRRANKSYKLMNSGRYWNGSRDDWDKIELSLNKLKRSSKQNLENMKSYNGSSDEKQRNFFERFQKLEFNLVHFSSANLHEDSSDSETTATFRSRVNLQKKGIVFNTDNTEDTDIRNLATQDFAFFSLNVGNTSGKSESRFGNNRYQIPLSQAMKSKYVKHGHVAINDTLRFIERKTDRDTIKKYFGRHATRDDISTLVREKIATSPQATIFHNEDFKEGLANYIIKSAKSLSPGAQEFIYSRKSDTEFDSLIAILYRPQFLVPKKLHTEHAKFSRLNSSNA